MGDGVMIGDGAVTASTGAAEAAAGAAVGVVVLLSISSLILLKQTLLLSKPSKLTNGLLAKPTK